MASSKNKPTNLDRQVEEVFATALGYIFKPFLHGCKQLKNKKLLIMFFISIALGILGKLFLKQLHPTFGFSLLLPVLFIWVLGVSIQSNINKNREILQSIKFVGRDEQAPILIGESLINKRITELTFKSVIPFSIWEESKELLETVLDRNIIDMKLGRSKKTCILSCLPSGYMLSDNILWNDEFIDDEDGIVVIGEDALGQIKFNLNKLPHIISAGETGSGKSVLLRCIAWQLIQKGARAFFFDFKGGVEFGLDYEQYGEVVTEPKRALEVLDMLVKENALRLALFREKRIKNLAGYNKKNQYQLCRIVVVIDEIAELLDKKGKTGEEKEMLNMIEGRLATLARLSRATGINLGLGAQRPDANVLPGQIKNNAPIRICGKFADRSASDIVLGNPMATKLPDIKGRFMYKVGPETTMFQAYYFDDDTMLKKVQASKGKMLIEKKKKKRKPA